MGCPQCGGGLTVEKDTPRIVPCGYCGATVFLPDDVWEWFHPVVLWRAWYVRFEGPRSADRKRLREQESRREASDALDSLSTRSRWPLVVGLIVVAVLVVVGIVVLS